MERDIEKSLLEWKEKKNRMPLLLRGARQVGKSYIVNKFGETHFENLVTVNFEQDPWLAPCFNNLHPKDIVTALSLSLNKKSYPKKLFFF